jgi:uncharacterized protein
MRKLRKFVLWALATVTILFLTIILLFFFYQEKILFYPQKLAADYTFEYPYPFDEKYIHTKDNINLHGLLFRADSARGLVFYLHGNGGSLGSWGRVAKPFLNNNYDCFVLDYRGYGKSEGEISSESQLLDDVNTAYQEIIKVYDEQQVIIAGYSIGTGPATYLASINNPAMLILKAPYNNLAYMLQLYYPWLPGLLLRYKLTTDEYLAQTKLPVVIFHGDNDQLIPYTCSLKLQEAFDGDDLLITLKGQGHNGISENVEYIKTINNLLD